MSSDDQKNAEMDKKMPGAESNNVYDLSREQDTSAGAGLETIQKILFGEQMRAGQQQVDRVKQESRNAVKELAGRLDGRIDQLTETMYAQFDALKQTLEQHASQAKVVEERTDSAIGACEFALTESIRGTRAELILEMKQSLADLENRSMDRDKLAEIFTEVAHQVTSDRKQTTA